MKFCMAVRRLTVPPIMAVCFLLVTRILLGDIFGGIWQFIGAIVFLGILPMLGYPLQPYLPYFKSRGRDGQRVLAMLFALAGYLLGIVCSLIFGATRELRTIYLCYLLSGLCIFAVNSLFHRRASGHSCGVFGPTALCVLFGLYVPAAVGLCIGLLTCCASLRTGRHTLPQLLGGCIIPCAVTAVIGLVVPG